MRLRGSALIGFAGTVACVLCAVAVLGRVGGGPDRVDLRLVDASGAISIANDREGQAVLTSAGLAPGATVSGRVTVDAGGGALWLREADAVDVPGRGGGRLSERLRLEVAELGAGAPRVVWSGRLGALPETALGSGAARTFRFTVTWPEDATAGVDNAYMAASTTVAFQWDATGAAAPATYPEIVAADAPTAYWDLGASAPRDQSGGWAGAFANTVEPGVTGVLGTPTAAHFDGATGYAYVNDLPAPRDAYTMEAWILPDGAGDGTVVEQGGAGALLLRGGRAVFVQGDVEISGGPSLAGAWHHVAGTWDGTTARLYVDGNLVASSPSSGRPSGAATLYIGYGHHAAWFAGVIDQVAYYPRALTAARLQAHVGMVDVPAVPRSAEPSSPSSTPSTGSSPAPVTAASPPQPALTGGDAWRRIAEARAKARAKAKAKALAKLKAKRRAAAKARKHRRPHKRP